ncbi:MAG: IF-2-associated domain-containing protein, partial [Rickettsiales bacterium]|nr:IF-2-associated domain-containing protein [Rickettsiales bacterium]
MSEQKKETLKVSPGKLQLTKTVESGKVKQNFTHGRSKSVTVEVRKTRTFAQGATGNMVEVKQMPGGGPVPSFEMPDDDSMRHLTPEERNSRMKALKIAEEEMKKAARKREEEALLKQSQKEEEP